MNAGPKNEPSSYARIAATKPDLQISAWLFLSDNPREVTAAKDAGMQSFVVVREGNAPLTQEEKTLGVVSSFEDVRIRGLQTRGELPWEGHSIEVVSRRQID